MKTCLRRSNDWWTLLSKRWARSDKTRTSLDLQWIRLKWGLIRWCATIRKSLSKSKTCVKEPKLNCHQLMSLLLRKEKYLSKILSILLSITNKIKGCKTKSRSRKRKRLKNSLNSVCGLQIRWAVHYRWLKDPILEKLQMKSEIKLSISTRVTKEA